MNDGPRESVGLGRDNDTGKGKGNQAEDDVPNTVSIKTECVYENIREMEASISSGVKRRGLRGHPER